MSVRQAPSSQTVDARQLKQDLETLRYVHLRNQAVSADAAAPELTMADLNETERSAASLGVAPDALKPIGFMNTSHYASLLRKNALAGPLAQKIEAFKTVSDADNVQGVC